MSASSVSTGYSVYEDQTLSPQELDLLGEHTFEHFEHFARFSTDRTKLFFAKVYCDDQVCGVAPVIKLWKHKSTELLKPKARRWLGPLIGPLARKTTYMVDNAFLAFPYRSPFYCTEGTNPDDIKICISNYLKAKRDAENVWISEPLADSAWMQAHRYNLFRNLPMVQLNLADFDNYDGFLSSLSKGRRRNIRREQQAFERAGGSIEILEPPISDEIAQQMYQLLLASSHRGWIAVPYRDVLDNQTAFTTQRQTALIARVNGAMVAFLSFVDGGTEFLHCHGGLDYDTALETKAYSTLLNTAIEHAVGRGFKRVGLGPLTNETKRRVGTEFLPMIVGLWSRRGFESLFSRLVVIPNMQTYTGSSDDTDNDPKPAS